MSTLQILRSLRTRRGLCAALVVLSLGGLVLARVPSGAHASSRAGVHSSSFHGPGAHGSLSLSQGKVLVSDRSQRVYAELRVKADERSEHPIERAPLSIAVVLDTSGSMSGEKIREAKRSVRRLITQMRDDDEIALVRYHSNSELVQPLASVVSVRERLLNRISELRADGGTNIPGALQRGVTALSAARSHRVRRLVLVSDGLDDTRARAVDLARDGAEVGITISALGIGLDFDEGYMAEVARAGQGNFGFVQDSSALANFLKRELSETATTMVRDVTARLRLPNATRFVRAIGAEARMVDGELRLSLGQLFAGMERRVVLELDAQAEVAGEELPIDASLDWKPVGASSAHVSVPRLLMVGTSDPDQIRRSRDALVTASCVSAIASMRQVEAASAYRRGDEERARQLIEQNLAELEGAAMAAPKEVAEKLAAQGALYGETKSSFAAAAPSSVAGRRAAKSSVEKDASNLSTSAFGL